MKKILSKTISLGLAIVMLAGLSAITLSAHGHGRNYSRRSTTTYYTCNVDDCNVAGRHYHNNVCYNGHYVGDGHDYHEYCSVSGCSRTGVHYHDGEACFPHTRNDGHSYCQSQYGRRGCHR